LDHKQFLNRKTKTQFLELPKNPILQLNRKIKNFL
jgi:hypothetical protein